MPARRRMETAESALQLSFAHCSVVDLVVPAS